MKDKRIQQEGSVDGIRPENRVPRTSSRRQNLTRQRGISDDEEEMLVLDLK